ncbi:glycoside hydrolase family 19 protein, partial [Citrobacter farmeri]|nr:chitinase [Citrobacter farmeri]
DASSTGDPVPLQFMADGTIAAYRINNDYLAAPYNGQSLRYSSTFILVKSQCQPDPQKEESWLTFYNLYMHLAPVKDYPLSPCYKIKAGHSGIGLRKYVNGQNGLPDGQESGDPVTYQAPPKTSKSLNAGDRFVSSRTGRFYVTKNHQTTLMTFGLVHLLKEDSVENDPYWVTLDLALVEQDGDIQALMPAWMQKAKAKGVFDTVVPGGDTEEWKVSAGTPVGFMGCMESPGEGSGQVDREWFVHLEVLSADPNMPVFLSNPGGVKGEKRTVLASKGTALYTRQASPEHPTFTATSATLNARCALARETTTPVADESEQWWYNITAGGWLPQRDVEEVNQYDLLKLGFQPLEENSSGDMVYSPYEGWVPEAFGSISRSAEQGDDWLYEQVPPFYHELMAAMDSNNDGNVTEEEIRQALVVRDPLVRDVVNRLTVKHHSEWFGGRSTGRWEGFYKDMDPEEVKYCEKWQADLEWMSQVPPFDKDEAVWHFHPVVFLDAIKEGGEYEITVELIEKLLGHTNPWFTGKRGGREFSEHFKNNYPDVYEFDKNNFVSQFNEQLIEYGITGAYHKAHFLSQCLHESAHFDTTLEFGSGHNYDPGQHPDAIKNGNTVIGDGPRYKGRGLIQLTWKKNYQRFSNHSGVDCVNNSDLVATIMNNAIKASCWFWRNNGGIHKKYDAKGDINILIDNENNNVELVTLAVNGGQRGLSERKVYFNAIKKEWGLD